MGSQSGPEVTVFVSVSLRKSKIGFLNPKESENEFSLRNRSIQDLSDRGASKEPKNPLPEWILYVISLSEFSFAFPLQDNQSIFFLDFEVS